MADKNRIVLAPQPRGVFGEGYLTGATAKPGQCVVLTPGQTDVDGTGRFTVEPAGFTAASGPTGMQADGDNILIRVLIEDVFNGRPVTTAYAIGDRVRFYTPLAGEQLNVMMQNQSGTGDDLAIGDPLMVDDGTGKVLKSTSTTSQTAPESEPFECNEVVTDPTADQLITVTATGN